VAREIRAAKVDWFVYSPSAAGLSGLRLLLPERWRRLHRKLCVVDQHTVFCGGINVLDDFYDPNHGELQAPRVDFAVAATGPLARGSRRCHGAAVVARAGRLQRAAAAHERGLGKIQGGGLRRAHRNHAARGGQRRGPAGPRAALILRDNLRNRSSIERAYRKAIGKAHREIIIANAYFLPGGKLRRALIGAARRGVRVTLLLQGRYEYFMQYHAARPVYGALLDAGVEIHEYEAGFLHAKVAVVDGHWATVGSSNLDPLSLLLAREANVVVEDKAFAEGLAGICARPW
jgi:cardiolipin synthase